MTKSYILTILLLISVVYGEKVDINIFYDAHNGKSRHFFAKPILDLVKAPGFDTSIKLTLYPQVESQIDIKCFDQNGPCVMNELHVCAQSSIKFPLNYKFISCTEYLVEQNYGNNVDMITQKCTKYLNIDENLIVKCIKSGKGQRLLEEYQTIAKFLGAKKTPTIIVDQQVFKENEVNMAQQDFIKYVCLSKKQFKELDLCKNYMDSTILYEAKDEFRGIQTMDADKEYRKEEAQIESKKDMTKQDVNSKSLDNVSELMKIQKDPKILVKNATKSQEKNIANKKDLDKQKNGQKEVKNDFLDRYREGKNTDETVKDEKTTQKLDVLPKTPEKPFKISNPLEKNIQKVKISDNKKEVNVEPKKEISKKISSNNSSQNMDNANIKNTSEKDLKKLEGDTSKKILQKPDLNKKENNSIQKDQKKISEVNRTKSEDTLSTQPKEIKLIPLKAKAYDMDAMFDAIDKKINQKVPEKKDSILPKDAKIEDEKQPNKIETVDKQKSLQSDISKKADSKPLIQEKPTLEAGAKKVKAQNIEKAKENVVEKTKIPKKTIETPNTKLDKPKTVPKKVEGLKSPLKMDQNKVTSQNPIKNQGQKGESNKPENVTKNSPVTNKDQKLSDKQVKVPEPVKTVTKNAKDVKNLGQGKVISQSPTKIQGQKVEPKKPENFPKINPVTNKDQKPEDKLAKVLKPVKKDVKTIKDVQKPVLTLQKNVKKAENLANSKQKGEPKKPENVIKNSPITNKDQKVLDKQVKGPEQVKTDTKSTKDIKKLVQDKAKVENPIKSKEQKVEPKNPISISKITPVTLKDQKPLDKQVKVPGPVKSDVKIIKDIKKLVQDKVVPKNQEQKGEPKKPENVSKITPVTKKDQKPLDKQVKAPKPVKTDTKSVKDVKKLDQDKVVPKNLTNNQEQKGEPKKPQNLPKNSPVTNKDKNTSDEQVKVPEPVKTDIKSVKDVKKLDQDKVVPKNPTKNQEQKGELKKPQNVPKNSPVTKKDQKLLDKQVKVPEPVKTDKKSVKDIKKLVQDIAKVENSMKRKEQKVEPKIPESISKISPVTKKDQKPLDKKVKAPEPVKSDTKIIKDIKKLDQDKPKVENPIRTEEQKVELKKSENIPKISPVTNKDQKPSDKQAKVPEPVKIDIKNNKDVQKSDNTMQKIIKNVQDIRTKQQKDAPKIDKKPQITKLDDSKKPNNQKNVKKDKISKNKTSKDVPSKNMQKVQAKINHLEGLKTMAKEFDQMLERVNSNMMEQVEGFKANISELAQLKDFKTKLDSSMADLVKAHSENDNKFLDSKAQNQAVISVESKSTVNPSAWSHQKNMPVNILAQQEKKIDDLNENMVKQEKTSEQLLDELRADSPLNLVSSSPQKKVNANSVENKPPMAQRTLKTDKNVPKDNSNLDNTKPSGPIEQNPITDYYLVDAKYFGKDNLDKVEKSIKKNKTTQKKDLDTNNPKKIEQVLDQKQGALL